MAKIAFEDLSGTSTPVTSNPYDGLITATKGDPAELQDRYKMHRITRNDQQKAKILGSDFDGWVLDEHLVKLSGVQKDPNYVDPRHCLVFWARPPQKVRKLVQIIQQKLKDAAPDIWLMPEDNLHMTVMEVTHSLTESQIAKLLESLQDNCQYIADWPEDHQARLIKPMLCYDTAALAISYLPAAGEMLSHGRAPDDDKYTYHKLRRDIYQCITNSGVEVGSRYVVPSAHLTIARFNSPNVFGGDPMDKAETMDIEERKHWLKEITLINQWLEAEFWPEGNQNIKPGGEWIVGEEKGLDFRKGTLWYGGGETIYLGKGFAHPEAKDG